MKTVLAFGDSLTWGTCPHMDRRHVHDARWPVALGAGLKGVEVISEGLRGRSTVYDRPASPVDMRGDKILPVLLHSHVPVDLVIIMLGTNDIFEGIENYRIRMGMIRLVEIIKHHPFRVPDAPVPEVLLVSPPPMMARSDWDVPSTHMVAQSEALGAFVAQAAEQSGAAFFDTAPIARASGVDGFHLEAEDSRAIGEALRVPVAKLLAI